MRKRHVELVSHGRQQGPSAVAVVRIRVREVGALDHAAVLPPSVDQLVAN